MRGIMLKVNEELFVLVGKVITVQEDVEKCVVTLEYEEYEQGQNITLRTDVVFWNQRTRSDQKALIPFADIVKKMRLKNGSAVMVTVRFRDGTHREANGYTCLYNGIISFPSDPAHDRGRSVVGGTVTWVYDGIDMSGDIYLSIGVYIGRDRYGQPQYVNVNTKDETLMRRCKNLLTPKADGIRMNAVFRCGDAYRTRNAQGISYFVYRAFDFTIKGSCNSIQQKRP